MHPVPWRRRSWPPLLLLAACSSLRAARPRRTPDASARRPRRPCRQTARRHRHGVLRRLAAGQVRGHVRPAVGRRQAATPRDVFVRRYTNIHDGIGELKLTVQADQRASRPASGQVPFHGHAHVWLYWQRHRDKHAAPGPGRQRRVEGRLDARPDLHRLTATTTVRVTPEVPKRGRILDRSGKPLADNGSILPIGVVPGEIKDEAAMLQALSDALGIPRTPSSSATRAASRPGSCPSPSVGRANATICETKIGSVPACRCRTSPRACTRSGSVAAHVVGYVGHPTADELRKLCRHRLRRDGLDRPRRHRGLGRAAPGGHSRRRRFRSSTGSGRVVREIARKAAVPGQDITLTLDSRSRTQAVDRSRRQDRQRRGARPARQQRAGAGVSQPSFDPNQFVIGLSDDQWQQLNGPDRPLVLRAAESAYPTGSIFKVITMAAGMEKGVAKTTDVFDCGLDWNGLPGVTLHNWQPAGHAQAERSADASRATRRSTRSG